MRWREGNILQEIFFWEGEEFAGRDTENKGMDMDCAMAPVWLFASFS